MLSPNRILVVNQRYFGDALISASLCVRLRELFPQAHIAILTFEYIAPILEGIGCIDEVIKVPTKPPRFEQFKWLLAHRNTYDVAFITQTHTRPFWYGLFMGRISVCPAMPWDKNSWWKKLLVDRIAPTISSAAQVEKCDALLAAIGIPAARNKTVPAPDAELPPQYCFDSPYVVLNPLPRCAYKQWPSENWPPLIERLVKLGFKVVLTGGPGKEEAELGKSLAAGNPHVTAVAGKLTFAQTARLIRNSAGYIGPDTGTTHAAAATGAPTVALFGPTLTDIWGPWAPGQSESYARRVPQLLQSRGNVVLVQKFPYPQCPCGVKGCRNCDESNSDCLSAITVDDVLEALAEARRNALRR